MVHESLPPFFFILETQDVEHGRRIATSIHVKQSSVVGTNDLQELQIGEMTPVLAEDRFQLTHRDLNFDGFLDLAFVTSRGTANTFAEHWVFSPTNRRFEHLGNYAWFVINQEARQLTNFVKGGDGGLAYRKNVYEFRGSLTLVRSEEQDRLTEDGMMYMRVIRERRNGDVVVIKRERVPRPD